MGPRGFESRPLRQMPSVSGNDVMLITVLNGLSIILEPLQRLHYDELFDAAQNELIWTFNSAKAYGEKFPHWFNNACIGQENGDQIPFVVRRITDKKIIGSTRFYQIDTKHRRLAIGYTWYVPEVWGSSVNPECKYLLLAFAFESLHFNRVEFFADVRNKHSRAAIKKLGAREEGILRQHMVLEDGFIRDSALSSIIRSEWPSVKLGLSDRLKQFFDLHDVSKLLSTRI